MHLFVWGSILVWFVVIPVTSTAAFYGSFFTFGGVAFEVLSTANFWFYLPLSAVIALAPTMLFRLIQLYQKPQYIDFVRLKEKKEGRKIFKRKTITRKHAPTRKSTKRSGYAFSHQEGYGNLITTGRIFGMDEDNVAAEHMRRRSVILSARSSRGGTERPVSMTSLPPAESTEKPSLAPPVSISDAIVRAGYSGLSPTVSIEVVEDENLNRDDGPIAGVSSDPTAGVSSIGPIAGISPEGPIAGVSSNEGSPPPRDAATGAAVASEETDSALISIRIPGLLDSPPARKEEEEKQEEPAAKESGEEEDTCNDNLCR